MAKLRAFFGILLSIFFLYLALRNIDVGIVAASFEQIELKYLPLCLACQIASLICRSYLWKNILRPAKDIRLSHSVEAIFIGYMGNNVLPFRMGEVMRAYAIGKRETLSSPLAFASILLERLIDIFVLLLFFVILICLMRVERWVLLSGISVFVFFVATLFGLAGLVHDWGKLPSLVYARVMQYVPPRFRGVIEDVTRSFARGATLITSVKRAAGLAALSLATWLWWTAILYFGLKAFRLDLPVTATLLLAVVINIGVMIPSSPGFIGLFQYLCILSLAAFNVPKEIALSFSLVIHAIHYVPTTLLGWFYLTRLQIFNYQGLKKSSAGLALHEKSPMFSIRFT